MEFKIDKRAKYLEEKDFVKYCKSLKLNITLQDLKYFSKQKLLYPYYSVVSDNIIDLEYNIYKNHEQYQEVIENGHPFDVAFKNSNTQIKKNTNSNDINYYARWQIIIIQELLNNNRAIEKKICSIKNYHLVKKTTSQFNSNIIEFEPLFQTITNNLMIETLLHDEYFKLPKEQNDLNIIEGILLEELNVEITTNSKKHYEKHLYIEWIKFIRKLVELYNNYIDIEKYKLADEIKIFLTTTINLIIDSEEKDFNQICIDFDGTPSLIQKIEDDIIFSSGDLKKIYPDDIELSIEKFKITFKDIADKQTIDGLIEFIKNKELKYIFLHIYDIEKIWFNREQYWERKLWAYMRSLTVGIEFYSKDIFSCRLGDLYSHLGFTQTNGDNSISSHLNKPRIGDAESLEDYIEKLNTLIEASKKANDQYKDEYFYHIFYLTRNFFAHKFKVDNAMTGIIFYPIYESLKKVLLKVYEIQQGQN
ncbi:hypothetical protein MLC52_04915 [Sulfurimonas sp. NW15]|uniref:hypothetical protein n=1 Tax=Sulfurimonas sp. NW15 TaxID=2922729 RepID=UPI003DA8835D